jgi:glycosyltransferase involved in cell wall biosynthesis
LRVALVHDWLNQVGGAENVLDELHALFPDAPVYTSMYWRAKMPANLREWDIRTTWLDRVGLSKSHHQWFLLTYPFAFRSLDLSGYDLVISNKSAFCINIRVPAGAKHLCNSLTPSRFVWNFANYVRGENVGGIARRVVPPILPLLRRVEYRAAQRVAHFAAISHEVQHRIQKYYRRESQVIYPPVDTERFHANQQPSEKFYLVISRLIPYKRIDLVVEAFNRLGLPLVVIGEGRERARLQALAKPNVKFLGRLSDAECDAYRYRCRAFIFPGEDDFGIAPVEAMAAGRPVIAFGAGGALDSVADGISGILFAQPSAKALVDAVRRFETMRWDSRVIQVHAEQYSRACFREQFMTFVKESIDGT